MNGNGRVVGEGPDGGAEGTRHWLKGDGCTKGSGGKDGCMDQGVECSTPGAQGKGEGELGPVGFRLEIGLRFDLGLVEMGFMVIGPRHMVKEIVGLQKQV